MANLFHRSVTSLALADAHLGLSRVADYRIT
jgi:hypothetical protein